VCSAQVGTGTLTGGDVVSDTTRSSAVTGGHVYAADHAIYHSHSPRVSACGTRYGQGRCTILWIKAQDNEWVLLPHGMLELAIHISTDELTAMVDRLRDKL
jgi:hypothetical protein